MAAAALRQGTVATSETHRRTYRTGTVMTLSKRTLNVVRCGFKSCWPDHSLLASRLSQNK